MKDSRSSIPESFNRALEDLEEGRVTDIPSSFFDIKMEDSPVEFQKVIDDNFWDLI